MYKSFFARQRRGDFDLANRDQLWNLLVQITLRKTRNVANRHLQGKRDVRREEVETNGRRDSGDTPDAILDRIDSDGPTPAEAALLNEALEHRFRMLTDPGLRQIAQWKLEGYTNPEIAQRLECTLRTVDESWSDMGLYWASGEA